MFKKLLLFIFFIDILSAKSANCADSILYLTAEGQACENVKDNETKAATRTRVTDKASYDAVENLNAVQEYKNKINAHDFNVMIYGLIDETLEDISVQTISEDSKQICVQITGKIKANNLKDNLTAFLEERGESGPTDIIVEAVSDSTENPLLNKEIAPREKTPEVEERGLLYVAPTVFYNGAVSDNHSKLVKHYLGSSDFFYVTDNEEVADYILYPRVDKARIDTINDGSSMLQMTVSFNLISADGNQMLHDEQNRTMILEKDKSEQQNAQYLLKKMFAKSCKKIMGEIEKIEKPE